MDKQNERFSFIVDKMNGTIQHIAQVMEPGLENPHLLYFHEVGEQKAHIQ